MSKIVFFSECSCSIFEADSRKLNQRENNKVNENKT